MLVFRQLYDQSSSTYTYLIGDADAGEAVLIDPVFEQVRRDRALLDELALELVIAADTHCHADHVTGAWLLQQQLGAKTAVPANSAMQGADMRLVHGDKLRFGARHLEVRETPGHTAGCVSLVLDDQSMVLTGDTLLIRGCGRTDMQGGDPNALYDSIWSQLFSLPDSTLVYPGHDYRGINVSSVGEEKRHNPRLGSRVSQHDFAGYMHNLGLPHPRKIDIAVPANQRCGRPEDGQVPPPPPAWAPLNCTFAGIWEIAPQWVEEHLDAVQLVDVREADEYSGPLGHISGAVLIPLGSLREQVQQVSRDRPVVVVCRSGARSAQATVMLAKEGFDQVANLNGGMLRWRAEGYQVVGGKS